MLGDPCKDGMHCPLQHGMAAFGGLCVLAHSDCPLLLRHQHGGLGSKLSAIAKG